MFKYWLIILIPLVLLFVLWDNSLELNQDSYKEILSTLLNVSSIVFAIIGAWIAIIYPKAISSVFVESSNSKDFLSESKVDLHYISGLVEIALISAMVLTNVLLIQFFIPIIKHLNLDLQYIEYLKRTLFFVVSLLTVSQVVSVSGVVVANFEFLRSLKNKNNKDRLDNAKK